MKNGLIGLLTVALLLVGFLFMKSNGDRSRPQGQQPGQPNDPISTQFFPPELIMGHQSEIALSDTQKQSMISEIQKVQNISIELQWKMQKMSEDLGKFLSAGKIDEAGALQAAEALMKIETEMKKTHLGLMIRLKNNLNETQQAKLTQLRGR